MLIKTTNDRAAAAAEAIRQKHRYEVPEILVLPSSSALPEYIAWVSAETTR